MKKTVALILSLCIALTAFSMPISASAEEFETSTDLVDIVNSISSTPQPTINISDDMFYQCTKEAIVIENGIPEMKIYDVNGFMQFGNILNVADTNNYVVEVTAKKLGVTKIVVTDSKNAELCESQAVKIQEHDFVNSICSVCGEIGKTIMIVSSTVVSNENYTLFIENGVPGMEIYDENGFLEFEEIVEGTNNQYKVNFTAKKEGITLIKLLDSNGVQLCDSKKVNIIGHYHDFVDGVCLICNMIQPTIDANDNIYSQGVKEVIVIKNGVPNMRIFDINGILQFGTILNIEGTNDYVVEVTAKELGESEIILSDKMVGFSWQKLQISVLMEERYFGLNFDGTVNNDEIEQITNQAGNETIEIILNGHVGISVDTYDIIAQQEPEKIIFKNQGEGWNITISKGEYNDNCTYYKDTIKFPTFEKGDYVLLADGTKVLNAISLEDASIMRYMCDNFTISFDTNHPEISEWANNTEITKLALFGEDNRSKIEIFSQNEIVFSVDSYWWGDSLFIANISGVESWLGFLREGNGLAADRYAGALPEVLEIPAEVGGLPVTSINNNAFKDSKTLKKVVMPDSVINIGEYRLEDDVGPFSGCENLEEIILSKNLEFIDNGAIEGTNIKSIKIPAKVSDIYPGSLSNAPLEEIEVDKENKTYRSEGNCLIEIETNTIIKGTNKSVIPNSVTAIEYRAFENCTNLTSITIPGNVTTIGSWAFYGCTNLTSITISDGVKAIEDNAFQGCTSLTSITLSDKIEAIGYYAFYDTGYYNDDSNWEDGVLYIGKYLVSAKESIKGAYTIKPGTKLILGNAFVYCSELTSITIPDSVTIIGNYAFSCCSALSSVTIPNSVTTIGESGFLKCASLTSITIPNSVTSIGKRAFQGCTSLTSITIPNSVTSIGGRAFEGCTNLASITIPNSVTSIGECAFKGCTNLASITLPIGITAIEYGTFYGCTNLTSITIPNSVTSIGECAFEGCTNLTSITIPNSVTNIGRWAFQGCENLITVNYNGTQDEWENINIGIGNQPLLNIRYQVIACLTYTIENGEVTITGCDNSLSGDITIPSTIEGYPVTSIGDDAFYYCTSLASITIPSSVTSIGDDAFAGCQSLTSIIVSEDNPNYSSIDGVLYNKSNTNLICFPAGKAGDFTIPNSVKSISDYAFHWSHALINITIPSSVTSIGKYAFRYCTSLASITIPSGVTSIGEWTFDDCTSLTSITIPSSVTSIGRYSFQYCYNLETVHFIGSEEEWNTITVWAGNGYLLNANIIFVCDHTFSNNVCSKCGTELNISTDGKFESVDKTATGNITVPLASNGVIVSSIGAGAFKDCASLSSVMLYDNITEIADDAFEGVSDNFVIKCYEDSPASVWAEENGMNCEIVPIPYGNVNADEATDIFDLIDLAKYTVGSENVIDTRAANTDAPDKSDRTVDIFDLIALAKHICNSETVLGPTA